MDGKRGLETARCLYTADRQKLDTLHPAFTAGTLKPALGFKIGYIFEGFWTTKEKSAN